MGKLIQFLLKLIFCLLLPPLMLLAILVVIGHGFAAVSLISDKPWARPVTETTGWVYRVVPDDADHWVTVLTHDFGEMLGVPEPVRLAAAKRPEQQQAQSSTAHDP